MFPRTDWEGKNDTQLATQFLGIQAQIGIQCPAVGLGWYKYGGATVRGARATRSLQPNEEVCVVPIQRMFSAYTIGNSSLACLLPGVIQGATREQLRIAPIHAAFAVFLLHIGEQHAPFHATVSRPPT